MTTAAVDYLLMRLLLLYACNSNHTVLETKPKIEAQTDRTGRVKESSCEGRIFTAQMQRTLSESVLEYVNVPKVTTRLLNIT